MDWQLVVVSYFTIKSTDIFGVESKYFICINGQIRYHNQDKTCMENIQKGSRRKSRRLINVSLYPIGGWLGGAMVLGKLPVPGRPTIWMKVGQGPISLAVGAGGGCLDIFTLLYPFSPLSPSLWETARYRLKYCLVSKGR